MTAQPTVLVVDDDADMRELIATLLVPHYRVAQAASGAECLDYVRRKAPDLVLLDVMMRDLDGDDACYNLKNDPATQHLPIVFVSALSRDEFRARFGEPMADGYLCKPVVEQELLDVVRRYLS
jgi:CheY-like chemotaxis protein